MHDEHQRSPAIALALNCQCQSGEARQLGFRLASDAEIRTFGYMLPSPSSRHHALMFGDWVAVLDSLPPGVCFSPFTRELRVVFEVDHDRHVESAHLTIARNNRTARVARVQGWITARKTMMLSRYVTEHMGERLLCDLVPGNGRDTLWLPGADASGIR
ncbi:MAG: hypothetical protein HOO96_40420 [Polyangiaceae bacterium]|nr:hypothetical protein [Polyangiaceae bacterium]